MRLSLHHHPVQFDSRHLQRLFRGVHLHHLCSLQTLHHVDRALAFPDLLDIQRPADQFFVTLIIILIWLAIIVLLIKCDVGGFGSSVLAPVLKDVPYVNKILPDSALDQQDDDGKPD